MAKAVGNITVDLLLRNGDPEAQRLAAQEFMAVELTDARAQAQQTLARPPRVDPIKIDTTKYSGDEKLPLRRWFCELDEAIEARQIVVTEQQVRYALSQLAGRAKSWAFGLKTSDRECFPSLDVFKSKLSATFEPPQSEFRMRAEFLSTRQGNLDLHGYIQKMRYLSSCVIGNPMDMSTQVTTFMTGLRDGPVKTQLFRVYPETLEEAFAVALGEDYNARQARSYGSRSRPSPEMPDAEPMDLSVVQTQGHISKAAVSKSFAPSYFDDIFVHSKAEDGRSAEAVHLDHLRRVFDAMRNNKLYANLKNDYAIGCALMQFV
ncbi:hypothetical protein P43SY_009302 [Pythium insidiosum]|uniref:Retrotransposon gag domain-containing protein n=1 Tax=Pythium insidiosum TaxID=114742 RepID=A0AAD5LY44_PYTIN|nr:hypothetical protein P43SY_009302 [Pythium insidiosum]